MFKARPRPWMTNARRPGAIRGPDQEEAVEALARLAARPLLALDGKPGKPELLWRFCDGWGPQ